MRGSCSALPWPLSWHSETGSSATLFRNQELLDRIIQFHQALYEPHGQVTYFRDKYGLRTFNNPLPKVELVTVGGSTTAQSLLSDGDTYQDIIHRKTGIVIANAGVDGMGTQSLDSVLEDWLFRIPELKPKFSLHYVGINDALKVQTVRIEDREKRYSWNRRRSPAAGH